MHQRTYSEKVNVQQIVFAGAIVLFVLKAVAFFLTNSVGILSDALESTVNIITGFITLKSLVFAAKPRDEDHPYGHGKVELITASVEGILIGVAGILIVIESIHRLGQPSVISKMNTGTMLMLITALANYAMGKYSLYQGQKLNSIALVAGGRHLMSDMYTTLALIGGLLVLALTGLAWIDSLLGIVFGIFILYTAYEVLRDTINGLMDETNPVIIQSLVDTLNNGRRDGWIDIHRLTHLTFGHMAHIDLHLTLPWYYNLRESTAEIMLLKQLIRQSAPETELDISVQSEPCIPKQCSQCSLDCEQRQKSFATRNFWTAVQVTGKNRYPIQPS